MTSRRKTLTAVVCATLIVIAGLLAHSAVDNSLSDEDRDAIPEYLEGIAPLPASHSFHDELRYVMNVQEAVHRKVKGNEGIPLGHPREPRELLDAESGLCFDRSRVIEKVLRYSGFETRHASIYSTSSSGSAVRALLSPRTRSHSVTEVLTQKGWIVVDSKLPWVSIDADGNPVSLTAMQSTPGNARSFDWPAGRHPWIYDEPFVAVYGLYSRHGGFFPPYNGIPDVHYGEMLHNFF